LADKPSGHRVVVVGGGVLGVCAAAGLARRGADVVLVTEAGLGSGASGRSLAWLNASGPYGEAYHRLRLLGMDRYRILASQLDAVDFLRFEGGLSWAADGDVESHRRAFARMRRVGYAAEWLTREEVASRITGVDARAIPDEGAIFNPGEGWVDLSRLIDHLADEVVSQGGRILTQVGRCRLVVNAGRVTGVRTAGGDHTAADAVLLATGAAVPGTLAEYGVAIPDATSTALLVRTEAVDTTLRAVLNTPRVSLRPTPDGALVVDSAWSAEEVVARAAGTYEVPQSTIRGLLEEASRVLEGNPDLVCTSYGVGPKPIPRDGEPVLGEIGEVSGLHVAFTHSGATLGLIAGELLADEIACGAPHAALDPFRPGRFT
jgi:glycine/D-amino acid oxidase-like deaminating enzyme